MKLLFLLYTSTFFVNCITKQKQYNIDKVNNTLMVSVNSS